MNDEQYKHFAEAKQLAEKADKQSAEIQRLKAKVTKQQIIIGQRNGFIKQLLYFCHTLDKCSPSTPPSKSPGQRPSDSRQPNG